MTRKRDFPTEMIADKYCRADGSPRESRKPLEPRPMAAEAADLERALRNLRARLPKRQDALWLHKELDLIHDALWVKGCVSFPKERDERPT